MYSKYQIIKIYKKLFSKYELLFFDQANSSSDPSQILILHSPIHTVFLPPSGSLSNLTQSSSCSSSVSIFCPRQSKANQVYYKLYTDHNTLWVKHATLQKSESLRAVYLSKLDNMVNKSIFNTKYAEFSTKC